MTEKRVFFTHRKDMHTTCTMYTSVTHIRRSTREGGEGATLLFCANVRLLKYHLGYNFPLPGFEINVRCVNVFF